MNASMIGKLVGRYLNEKYDGSNDSLITRLTFYQV